MKKEFWNERYQKHETVYGQAPNAYFREQLSTLSPGRILLPAEGEGRNALYAAAQGWEVWAFDQSDVARDKTLAQADKLGLRIQYSASDALTYALKTSYFDVVGLFYAHFPPDIRPKFHHKLLPCVKPGGLIILEAFHTSQLGKPSGGPKIIEMLLDEQSLKTEFSGFEFSELMHTQTLLDEGPFHQGMAEVIRMIAQKPS